MARENIVINASPGAAGSARYPVGVLSFNEAVERGDISNAVAVHKVGYMHTVNIADCPEDLTNTKATYLGQPVDTADTLEVLSGGSDDAAAGTGARTVTISGLLDEDYEEQDDVVVTLDGTTAVSLGTAEYLRAGKMVVTTAGSGGVAAALLTLRQENTTTNILAQVEAGDNSSFVCAGTVPADKTLVINRGFFDVSHLAGLRGHAVIALKVRENVADAPYVEVRKMSVSADAPYLFEHSNPVVITEQCDYKVTVESVGVNAAEISGELSGYLRDDTGG